MDAVVSMTRNVSVIVRENADGTLSWTFNNNPGSGDVLLKRSPGDIIYMLQNSPGFEFCAPPHIYSDTQGQLVNPSFTAMTSQVTDLYTVMTPDEPMGLYLFVQGPGGKTYQSPDPEIINTEGG